MLQLNYTLKRLCISKDGLNMNSQSGKCNIWMNQSGERALLWLRVVKFGVSLATAAVAARQAILTSCLAGCCSRLWLSGAQSFICTFGIFTNDQMAVYGTDLGAQDWTQALRVSQHLAIQSTKPPSASRLISNTDVATSTTKSTSLDSIL